MMSTSMDELTEQLAIRDRFVRRRSLLMSPAQRIEAMRRLQQSAWDRLRQSPEGYAHFIRRNFKARAVDTGQVHGR
jgi:hypothetical protein